MTDLIRICQAASAAKYELAKLNVTKKNEVLLDTANRLMQHADEIIEANGLDMERAKAKNMPAGLQDRLRLDLDRIAGIAEGLRQLAMLEDPIGDVVEMKKRPNGLLIGKRIVPVGVIGVIYEARPNVTADVFALCFKTGNAVVCKGGSDAMNSNQAIVSVIKESLRENNITEDAIGLIADGSRETTREFMKMNQYLDLLIPRGGAGLIRSVVENATVPVIETGTGNCHIYVDEDADFEMALDIVENAKTQRIGVCNAAESLLVHRAVAETFLPMLEERLKKHQVELRGDQDAVSIFHGAVLATEEDWGKEYLDYKMSVKIVDSLEEAISHINKYNTGHSEAIITNNYQHAEVFLNDVDAACVYVNASTRFTDGFEFGFGAEIGISTQKLHARGPMGLMALTSYKYVIYGNGQIRK
ncbi:glutamate-5-semialdehyde dehydrogenase [Lachnospiraceae bacterium A10]|nr:glutamate-5-semialdehyde dehydrogenase [Lachnospiraceae bacterium A10]